MKRALRRRAFLTLGVLASLTASCSRDRTSNVGSPVFDTDVAPILAARCVGCHTGPAPAGGWNAGSYLGAIGCVSGGGAPTTLPDTDRAPIVLALSKAPHVGLASADESATIAAWVSGGAPARASGVHPAGIVDPRSPSWHGTVLRNAHWTPMLDATDPQACGTCHDGTPAGRPHGVTIAAPGATACTTCHVEAGGAAACSTCHGQGARTYPPRDLCFFPADAAKAGAHAAHVESSRASATGLSCSTCHAVPQPGSNVMSGLHGNGSVEVIFSANVAPERSFDLTAKACAVSCHDRGGARPRPVWSDKKPMGCNDCHTSPPAAHFPGACTSCHAEANTTGTALVKGPLHMNGLVDLGDGSGGCGACHGKGTDPWPRTAAHKKHETPTNARPVDCNNCHVVPTTLFAQGHLDGAAAIVFGGHAKDRGANPAWSGNSCSEVACHGAKLADAPAVPLWTDTSGTASACTACHGIPPSQHTPSTSCELSGCHGTEVTRSLMGVPQITGTGRLLHVNGTIDLAP